MKPYRSLIRSIPVLLVAVLAVSLVDAAEIDWRKIRTLKDKSFLQYVESLDLKGQAALDFWKNIPLSRANRQIYRRFRQEALAIYMKKYPRPKESVPVFRAGMGTSVRGPKSGQRLKLPFTAYHPLEKGPVGDPGKTYRIGYTIHGFDHPWLLNNADSAIWEANRHPNVALVVRDPGFDNDRQVQQIDQWIEEGFDGIIIWPMQEAPIGPPVDRAIAAGIPTVSVDRMVGTRNVSARITGNFPANGAQQGMYLVHRLLKETGEVRGAVLMIRKPLGSTADAMRTGHFLKVLSYFPGLRIVDSFHNSSNREASFQQVRGALKEHRELDAIFCTGAEQGMGAVRAVDTEGRWDSRVNGRRIIVLSNDDLYEALQAVRDGRIAMTAPYTPLLGGLGLRIMLKLISGQELDQDVITPDLPMITKDKETIFGVDTIGVNEWIPYSYGRDS